ncbi:YlxQ-related RNA-binding protein [Enterococcus sp. BWB1-3]|uniref:YlxQ-related RNA-binding protein n=1 Tax=unclassified Enterococcus TaxID=2608891 RepID=UPI001924A534|nr:MULTISPECIES: YlxQ-related RNA-binding protein [unclassified Enterococcus]MBL1229458.1 YlxQ-related RNA-binding protein [Enterococcus sp. BWB1-3]MCB5952630.1 YlxQ-related RNA-binding protein [Enterococcus sp. BWT-B8]MCB5956343.1 YlxQ-related RNA-binding protein [Enterococcus sp. CWB-B31]
MNKEKTLNLLGLAMRAGRLITGEEMTVKDIQKNKTEFVFIAADASDNTRKKIKDKCSYYEIPWNDELLQIEISHAIGRQRMIVGVNDQGFAKKFKELTKC